MDRRKIVEKLEQAEQENLNTKPKRAVVAVYWILRLIVIGVMVMTIIHKNYESTFVCVLVLILFMLPRFVERNFRIELPSTLEIIILVFIFAAEILGELKSYFITYPHWDSMLHTTTGFISAAFGFALVDLLNRNKPQHFKLSPVFLALVAFCFSMTVGVLWEFFEFSMDYLFHMDMQKDTVIHAFASVTLDPTNNNIPILVDNITDVAVNGKSLGLGGYLDVGLYDTMQDLFVNFVGALTFSIIGYFSAKSGKNKIAKQFVPVVLPEETADAAGISVFSEAELKVEVVNAHRVALLDAHCLEPVKQTGLAQHAVKIHPRLVVAEVDRAHESLQPRTLHDPEIIEVADLQLVARADLRLWRDVVGLIRLHRRDLGKLCGARLHEFTRAGVGGGAHLEEIIALRLDVCAQAVDVRAVVAEQVALVGGDDLHP